MWAIFLSIGIGIWITAAPHVLGYGPPTSTSDWITGPLIASLSTMALWPVLRGLFTVNVVFCAWLLLGPWLFDFDVIGGLNSAAAAIALFLLSRAVPPANRERFGGGWSSLRNHQQRL